MVESAGSAGATPQVMPEAREKMGLETVDPSGTGPTSRIRRTDRTGLDSRFRAPFRRFSEFEAGRWVEVDDQRWWNNSVEWSPVEWTMRLVSLDPEMYLIPTSDFSTVENRKALFMDLVLERSASGGNS